MGTTSETNVKKADNAAEEADLPDCPGEKHHNADKDKLQHHEKKNHEKKDHKKKNHKKKDNDKKDHDKDSHEKQDHEKKDQEKKDHEKYEPKADHVTNMTCAL